MGRPSEFTQEIADILCERIAQGESVRTIAKDELMPASTTIYRWLQSNGEFREQYARAKEIQAEVMADELLEIADDGSNDWMTKRFGETEVEMPNPEVLQRSKLRVDTRKWIMSKLLPKKYGDKLQHTGGDGEGPVQFVVTRAGAKEK